MAYTRVHGPKAVKLAKKCKLGFVFAYAEHEPGRLAGCEEKRIPIEIAERVAEEKPWLVYVDCEEPGFRWWNPFTWFRKKQETAPDAADPSR